jgi:hypothetical protein
MLFGQATAHAEDLNALLQRLVAYQDSWQDFKNDPAKGKQVGVALDAQFKLDDKKQVHVPRAQVTYLGYPVFELTPDTAGMGLGFTVTVKAPIDKVRKSFEAALGKKLGSCETGDGMTACSLELAPKRTAILMAPTANPEVGTLVGCYYEYER